MSLLALASAATFVCTAAQAIDGDTLRCAGVGRVRLAAIDAPEMPGHCRTGRACTPGDPVASKRALAALIRSGRVTCTDLGRDRWGRVLAQCQTAARGDLSCAMVASGQAVERYRRLDCPAG